MYVPTTESKYDRSRISNATVNVPVFEESVWIETLGIGIVVRVTQHGPESLSDEYNTIFDLGLTMRSTILKVASECWHF